MASKPPATIAEYIRRAPAAAQPHLRELHALLKRVAPDAEETIKWGQPFFIEPRYLFSFSAYKAHINFAPSAQALAAFREELAGFQTTKNFLQIRHEERIPEELVRRIAEYQLQRVGEREDDGFW